ncbi:spore germination protein, partial [Pseudomonas sp. FW305-BF6]|uniref:spore germination protein n=1 Tax=Pseudomonas sp. FW305-BF6 TaxID=2070673 RepID=UPI00156E6329
IWIEVLVLLFLLQILGIGSYKISKEMIILLSLIATITISTTAVDAKLIHPLSLIVIGVSYLAFTVLSVGILPGTIYVLRYVFLFMGSLFG